MGRFLRYIAGLLNKLSYRIDRLGPRPAATNPARVESLRLWFEQAGDSTHRLNYLLDEQSVVFDMGGYEGEWAGEIFCRYGASIYIFEPYEVYFNNIRLKFLQNKKVKVFKFGLSGRTEQAKLAIAENSSSTFINGSDYVTIELIRAADFIAEHKLPVIDLMKINIEGGEYDLLEHVIETGLAKKIVNIQVQFHDFVPDAARRMAAIQQALARTHHLTYQFEFVWENWQLNKP